MKRSTILLLLTLLTMPFSNSLAYGMRGEGHEHEREGHEHEREGVEESKSEIEVYVITEDPVASPFSSDKVPQYALDDITHQNIASSIESTDSITPLSAAALMAGFGVSRLGAFPSLSKALDFLKTHGMLLRLASGAVVLW